MKKKKQNISNVESDKTLKNRFLEFLPLFSLSNSYIQSTMGALIPIFLLANTGVACAIISSSVDGKMKLFKYFTSAFIISILFYVFSLFNLLKIRNIIFKCINNNFLSFTIAFSKIEKAYDWYLINAIISILISFITFFYGITRIVHT